MKRRDHNHSQAAPKHITNVFVTGLILNAAFVLIEAIAGLYTHSVSPAE
ncbi:MAG: hypothetical protein JST26_04950 [Bacteroidetes bacterium]|nr:hypothetical protein [Bacteroidota bacterium]